MKKYLKLIRIKHWLKNGIIFFPLVFDGQLLVFPLMIITTVGAIAFSLIASTIYIINDLKDIEKDKLHEAKKNRPLAAGTISIQRAKILIFVICIAGFGINFYISTSFFMSTFLLMIYLILNIMYSLGLKNIPLIDVAILVSGYLLRLLYGSVITGIGISNWMYLTILTMAFYLGLGKRRNEFIKNGAKSRKVLNYYSKEFLDKNMYMFLALTIVFYSMWCTDTYTVASQAGGHMVWTVPLVILICMKYSMIIEGGSYGDPVDVLIGDKILIGLVLIYGIVVLSVIYGQYLL